MGHGSRQRLRKPQNWHKLPIDKYFPLAVELLNSQLDNYRHAAAERENGRILSASASSRPEDPSILLARGLARRQAAYFAAELTAIRKAHKEPAFTRRLWRRLLETEGGAQNALRQLRKSCPAADPPLPEHVSSKPHLPSAGEPKIRRRRAIAKPLAPSMFRSAMMIMMTLWSLNGAAAKFIGGPDNVIAIGMKAESVIVISVLLVFAAVWRLSSSRPCPSNGQLPSRSTGSRQPPPLSAPEPGVRVPSSLIAAWDAMFYRTPLRLRGGAGEEEKHERRLFDAAFDAAAAPGTRKGGTRLDSRGVVPGTRAPGAAAAGAPSGGAPADAPADGAPAAKRRRQRKKKGDHEAQIDRHTTFVANWSTRREKDVLCLKAVSMHRDVAMLVAASDEYEGVLKRASHSWRFHPCCIGKYVAADELLNHRDREAAYDAADRHFRLADGSPGSRPQIEETDDKLWVVCQGRHGARKLPVPTFHCAACNETWCPNAVSCFCWPSAPCNIIPPCNNLTQGFTRWITLDVLDDFARLHNGGGVSAEAYAAFLAASQSASSDCAAYFGKRGFEVGGAVVTAEFHTFDAKLLMNAHFSYQNAAELLPNERKMGIVFKVGIFDCPSCATLMDHHHASGCVGMPVKSCSDHATIMMDGSVTMKENAGSAVSAKLAADRSPSGLSAPGVYFTEANRELNNGDFKGEGEPRECSLDPHNDLHCSRPVSRQAAPGTAAVGIAAAVCPHGYPVRGTGINMRSPENWDMFTAILYHAILQNTVDTIRTVYLDFGCLFKAHFFNFLKNDPRAAAWACTAGVINFFVDWLHARGHRPWCRFANGAMYVCATGRRIGAQCEELWAKVRVLWNDSPCDVFH